ncbi:MAG: hypothetical protein U1E66_14110 [Rhodospirillales bacterium]
MAGFDKYDEYKFFVGNTQHLDDRRQGATQMFLSVNTAIFALVGFLIQDAGVQGQSLTVLVAPLFVLGVLACVLWVSMINRFKRLIGWRFEQLMAMERAIPECHQMYVKEWEAMFRGDAARKILGLSLLDWLPRAILGLWVIYGCAFLVTRAVMAPGATG